MNRVTCPRCHGTGEERVCGSAAEGVPDEWRPCLLCLGFGDAPEQVAQLYRAGKWQLTACDECGRGRLCVDDGLMVLCAACWPVVDVSQQEAAS